MSSRKQELQQLAHDVQNGKYVKKSTVYFVGFIALAIGLYFGGLITTLQEPVPQAVSKRPVSPQQQAKADLSSVSPDSLRHILDLEKVVLETPDNVDAWTHLAHLYAKTSQYKKAIKAYNSALQLKPDEPDLIVDLGVAYRRDHQHDKAIEMFDKALTLEPKHEIAHFNKGIVLYYDKGAKEEALGVWRKLELINPAVKAPNGLPLKEMITQLSK